MQDENNINCDLKTDCVKMDEEFWYVDEMEYDVTCLQSQAFLTASDYMNLVICC